MKMATITMAKRKKKKLKIKNCSEILFKFVIPMVNIQIHVICVCAAIA